MRPNQVRAAAGSLLAAASLATLILPSPTRAADARDAEWAKISFKVQKLAEGLYMFEGEGGFAGGNIGALVGKDGILLVDSSFAQLSPKLEAGLKKLSDKPIRFVINTHFHGDHTSGNSVLGAKATVIAHENTRRRLMQDGFKRDQPAPPQALPLVTLDERLALYLDGEEIRVAHVAPAHTDSDVVVRFKNANVVHLGDLFFNGMFPFIDVEHGGSVKGYVAAVEQALAELPPGAKIIPGHGPVAGREQLEAYLAMLKETIAVVEKGLAQNRSLANLRQSRILAAYETIWGKGLINSDEYLELLYRGLAAKAPL